MWIFRERAFWAEETARAHAEGRVSQESGQTARSPGTSRNVSEGHSHRGKQTGRPWAGHDGSSLRVIALYCD